MLRNILKHFGPAILVSISADVRHLDLLTIAGYYGKKYGMTRPHLIAKLIFTAVGISFLMQCFGGIVSTAIMLSQNTFTIRMSIIAAKSAITLAVSLILLFRSDGLVISIAGPDANECEKVDERWIIAGLQLVTCFCGLLFLYRRIEFLFYYIFAFTNNPDILSHMKFEGQPSNFSIEVIILMEITRWIFAIYLIFGAPHYVRRQMQAITMER